MLPFFSTYFTPLLYSSFLSAILLLSCSCQKNVPTVVSAEIFKPGEGDNPYPDDPVIKIEFSQAFIVEDIAPHGWKAFNEGIRVSPSVACFFDASLAPNQDPATPSKHLYLKIRSQLKPLEPKGLFRLEEEGPSSPSGIGVPIDGTLQWVDLQRSRKHPRLDRAYWEDINGNWVVDRGDELFLQFDRAVQLSSNDAINIRCPEDLYLANPEDRIGLISSEFQFQGKIIKEDHGPEDLIKVVLGDRPHLIPSPAQKINPGWLTDSIPGSELRPSSIAVHGTELQPLFKIVSTESNLGAVSDRTIGIELPVNHAQPIPLIEAFPSPGPRSFLGATVLLRDRILLVGGLSRQGEAIDQILEFSPRRIQGQRLRLLASEERSKLKQARYLHTQTLLPGKDKVLGTEDDFLVIIGGLDGTRAASLVEIIRFDKQTNEFVVEASNFHLEVPRYGHTATAIRGNEVLILGGTLPGGPIIEKAELITFEFPEDGSIQLVRGKSFFLPARTRHTAISLRSTDEQTATLFVHGGLGNPEGREVEEQPSQEPLSLEVATILNSPWILTLKSGTLPKLTRLDIPWSYSRLRYDHLAIKLKANGKARGKEQVLLSGGSIRPLYLDPRSRIQREWWELPRNRAELSPEILEDVDEGLAAHSLLFTFDSLNPADSTLDILPSSSGELRVDHVLLPLPGVGILSLGGENPRSERDRDRWSSGELYLNEKKRMFPFSIFLGSDRSRFGAVSLGNRDRTQIFIFGGEGSQGDNLPDILEINLH